MKLLSVCTFLCCVFSIRSEKCNDNWSSCSDVADIATITCDTTTRSTCTVKPGELTTQEEVNGLVVDPTFDTIDSETCRKKCQEQANSESEHKCEFFRWVEDHSETKKTTCSLQTTCEHDQYCDSFACVTGQLPDCDEDGNKIFPCPLSSPTVWDNTKFHVICTDPLLGDVNIYNSTITSVPGNTVCSTIRMCDAWDEIEDKAETFYRKLAIKCNGIIGSGVGTWEPMTVTGSAELSGAMQADNTIIEQTCDSTCDDLTISIPPNQYWADLICDTPLEEGGILKDGNSCILLCDNHLKMSIDCEFTREGDKQWHDGEGNVVTAATVKC